MLICMSVDRIYIDFSECDSAIYRFMRMWIVYIACFMHYLNASATLNGAYFVVHTLFVNALNSSLDFYSFIFVLIKRHCMRCVSKKFLSFAFHLCGNSQRRILTKFPHSLQQHNFTAITTVVSLFLPYPLRIPSYAWRNERE